MSDGRARSSRLFLAIVVTFAAAFAARGAGSIETDDATALLPGDAPRPGLVLADPDAQTGFAPFLPAVAPPAALGAPPAAPAFDAGPGGSDLSLAGAVTMPGGAYDCANFYVDKNAYVLFTGPTTIRATGWAMLYGRVLTTADDAPLSIASAGTMTIGSYPRSYGSIGGASTEGLRSDLTLVSASTIGSSYGPAPYFKGPQTYAAKSSVHVRAAALNLGPGSLSAGLDVDVETTGDVTSRGLWYGFDEQGWVIAGVVVKAEGTIALRAEAGSVMFQAGEAACGGRMTIEAGAGIALDSGVTRLSAGGGMDLTAYGGRIDVTNGALVFAGTTGAPGTSTLRARDGIGVTGAVRPSLVTSGNDRLVIESIAGDVIVGDEGATTGNDVYPAGFLELRTNGAVRVRDGARVGGARGAGVAATGEVSAGAGAAFDGGDGALLVEGASVTVGANARANGGSVTLRTPGALSIAAGARVDATVGDIGLLGAPLTIAGVVATSGGDLRATSLSGTADLRGATLSSRDVPASFLSGSVEAVAFGAGGTILAQGATLRSGAAAAVSGDVMLRVVAEPAPDLPPPAFDAPPGTPRVDPPYVVPSSATLRAIRGDAMQELELRGFVDFGVAGPLAGGTALVTVGDAPLAASLSAARRGTAVARGADVVVRFGPAAPGSARRPLTLRARGSFLPEDLAGDLAIRLDVPGASAACRVRLEAGRFDARHGALVAPALFVADVRATRDGVRLTLGVPAADFATSAPPDVELFLADGVRHVAPADFATTRDGRLVATTTAPGLARITIDPSARTLAAEVPLDALGVPAPGGALDVALRIDGRGVGALRVVVGRSGARIVY